MPPTPPKRSFPTFARRWRTALAAAGLAVTAGCGDPADSESPGEGAAAAETTGGASTAAVGTAADRRAALAGVALTPLPVPGPDATADARVAQQIANAATLVTESPRDAALRRQLALALDANGFDPLAIEAWRQALVLDPDNASNWYHLARMRYETGDIDGAIDDMTRSLALDETQAASRSRRAFWYLERGDVTDAEREFARVGAEHPDHLPARLGMARLWIQAADSPGRALERILIPLREAGNTTPPVRLLTGQALQRLGRPDEAEPELLAGAGSRIAWMPHDPWASEVTPFWVGEAADLARARALITAGRLDQAIALLEPLVVDPATDAPARTLLGGALLRAADAGRASKLLADGLAVRPDETPMILALAQARLALGDAPAAARLADRAIATTPGSAEAHGLRAELQLADGNVTAAEASARRAIELEPARFRANLILGLAIDRQPSRRPEAFRQLQRTRQLHPGEWEPYYYLGAMLGTMGQIENGLLFAVRAAELAPREPRTAQLLQRLRSAPPQATRTGPAPVAPPGPPPAAGPGGGG